MVIIIKKEDSENSIKKKLKKISQIKKNENIESLFGVMKLKFDPVADQRRSRNESRG